MRILVAGIGNIFHGDDAFGCEVIRQLAPGTLPAGVVVTDFGIRSYDLAYALTDGYDAVVLVDAASRGREPGTVYLIEPDLDRLSEFEASAVDAHSMNPVAVIQMAQSLGGVKGQLYLVGCEPEVLEDEAGSLQLSAKVKAAIPEAISMIAALITGLREQQEKTYAGAEPA